MTSWRPLDTLLDEINTRYQQTDNVLKVKSQHFNMFWARRTVLRSPLKVSFLSVWQTTDALSTQLQNKGRRKASNIWFLPGFCEESPLSYPKASHSVAWKEQMPHSCCLKELLGNLATNWLHIILVLFAVGGPVHKKHKFASDKWKSTPTSSLLITI